MKSIFVKELMVPLDDYATVSQEASLYEAILSLENAQEKVGPAEHKHRAILALDDNGTVVGKVSMVDVLTALEPKYEQLEDKGVLSRSGYSKEFIRSMLKDHYLWDEPLENLCKRAPDLRVKDFMEFPAEGTYIDEDASLDEAIHQMVVQRQHSLLVTREENVVGILRLSDVFALVARKIKECGF